MKKLINKILRKDFPYGPADIKRTYRKYVAQGMFFAIAMHVLVIGAYVTSIYIEKSNASNEKVLNVREIIIADIDLPPKPMIEEPEMKIEEPVIEKTKFVPLKDDAAMTPEPVRSDIAEVNTTKVQDELDKINTIVSKDGDENASRDMDIASTEVEIQKQDVVEKIEEVVEKVEEQKQIFETFEVEKAPSPLNLGEVKAMMRYPDIAVNSGLEGNVVAKVLVGRDGKVQRIGNLTGPNVFHAEVRSKLNNLQFTPAVQNGKTVQCWISVPFSFKLKS